MPKLPNTATLLERLLETIEEDILPLTSVSVAAGNKVFGAALISKADLSTVLAETNCETVSPLHHGEMHLLKRYHEWPEQHRPRPESLIFLSTHEPCSMCASAIAWSGFDNIRYFFTHEDSRDAFGIPHDLKILKEVFDVDPGGYRRENAFFDAGSILEAVKTLGSDQLSSEQRSSLLARAARIQARYTELSEVYQSSKVGNAIPLA